MPRSGRSSPPTPSPSASAARGRSTSTPARTRPGEAFEDGPPLAAHPVRQRARRPHLPRRSSAAAAASRGWSDLPRGGVGVRRQRRASSPPPSPCSGPTLMKHGTDEQKAFYVPRLLSGEDAWCQLFSEPGAGSDLADLGMPGRPRRRRVRGHRPEGLELGRPVVQLGHAARAHRPRRAQAPRASPSCCVDMDSPGIEVRPLVQATGRRPLQRGVPQRGPRPRRQRPRRDRRAAGRRPARSCRTSRRSSAAARAARSRRRCVLLAEVQTAPDDPSSARAGPLLRPRAGADLHERAHPDRRPRPPGPARRPVDPQALRRATAQRADRQPRHGRSAGRPASGRRRRARPSGCSTRC